MSTGASGTFWQGRDEDILPGRREVTERGKRVYVKNQPPRSEGTHAGSCLYVVNTSGLQSGLQAWPRESFLIYKDEKGKYSFNKC